MLTSSILNQYIYICLEVENHNYCGNGILSKPYSDHRFVFPQTFISYSTIFVYLLMKSSQLFETITVTGTINHVLVLCNCTTNKTGGHFSPS